LGDRGFLTRNCHAAGNTAGRSHVRKLERSTWCDVRHRERAKKFVTNSKYSFLKLVVYARAHDVPLMRVDAFPSVGKGGRGKVLETPRHQPQPANKSRTTPARHLILSRKQLRQLRDIRCDPPHLIFGEQLGRRSAPQPMAVMTSARLAVTWPRSWSLSFWRISRSYSSDR
jgi:hypothetical protein